jgi:hypothetical protein
VHLAFENQTQSDKTEEKEASTCSYQVDFAATRWIAVKRQNKWKKEEEEDGEEKEEKRQKEEDHRPTADQL